ncbi:M23 family metallopeptidase [Paenibacillus tarimensis]|uniref:M23 family metallopeptidase n=1 Tax=Paenibacillus tarimensis TaxID=416012 RepID=UPI002E20E1ED
MMNDQEKMNQSSEEAPKMNRGSKAAGPSAWKRFLSKKWVSPAAFMAAAAIIVTLMWVYQGTDKAVTTSEITDPAGVSENVGDQLEAETGEDSVPVTTSNEALQWPVADREGIETVLGFYDAAASADEREKAMVVSGSTYYPHMGIDLAKPDNSTFDVAAAMSGTVTMADSHPTNGDFVEITHEGGLVTVYQSLSEVQVKEGDQVKQGDLIAKAGQNELEKDLGVHVHFEVRENGSPINPAILLEE